MAYVTSIAVEGFWDTYDLKVAVDPKVNFFIGQNGTGKTTLINMLAAALTGDFRTLDRMAFRKITILLNSGGKDGRASIVVSKSKKKDRSFDLIDYKINSGKPGSKELRFSLDDMEEQLMIRRMSYESRYMEYYRRIQYGLVEALSSLVSVNWLSIHRNSPPENPREGRSYESSVDQKLESQSNDLVRYFATLSGQKDNEIRLFQESLFISLVEQSKGINDPFELSKLDRIKDYTKALNSIFGELHVSRDTKALTDSFEERANEIKYRHEGTSIPNLRLEEAVFLFGLHRIEDVVKRWEALQERLKQIFEQRDRFVEIADELFQRKKLTVSDSNELVFESRSGKRLTPQMLSSGEKQLLILMSEALLQRRQTSIFIADEPELSLHVLWQERLVSSLRTLNPNAQIIAATHSPDIVGPLSEKAIDMESLIG